MKVRLRARHSLLVGLVAVAGASGCVDKKSKSDLDPDGPPKILQVFVRDFNNTDDPVGGEYALAYGIHPDVYKCSFDNTCATMGFTCDTTASSPTVGHCLDSSGKQAAVTSAAAIASIRIVSKELLRGTTLEQFACACHGGCPSGMEWAIDPENCSVCGEDSSTPITEAGKCLDVNNDHVPDISTLQAGVATITCGSLATFPPYTTKLGDGYYYPSGNQFPTSGFGYGGIGPALVIEPAIPLPTSQTCTVTVASSVTDKDGNSFEAPTSPITFKVEELAVTGTAPEDEEEEVDPKLADITISYNVPLKEDSVNATSVTMKEKGGAAVAGIEIAADGSDIVITLPTAGLKPLTDYTVTVTDAVTDLYGVKGSEGTEFTFTTDKAAMP